MKTDSLTWNSRYVLGHQPVRYAPSSRLASTRIQISHASQADLPAAYEMLAALTEGFPMTASDLAYLHHSLQIRTIDLFAPRGEKGPRPPNPKAGFTQSGLPIRNPRRYGPKKPRTGPVLRLPPTSNTDPTQPST
ncbi:hypothetical protein [Streptomyces sp. NBC_00690]|uniref:hypothetical protein n=1 Tax=Streptomyces sp. NBC_00690 TaxID=2975808 RepID=UPI002E289680|nr:hypothetical protein [Streptomyces sp. NBC_00690]